MKKVLFTTALFLTACAVSAQESVVKEAKSAKSDPVKAAQIIEPALVDPSTAIPYLAQYKETVFNFMNRLSMQYGEWFYYDGKDIFFGNPNKTESTKIIYDMDLEEVRLIANLIPGKYKGYSYEYDKNDTPINAEPSVPSMDSYQKQAHDMSEKAYSIPAIQVS